MIKLFEHNKIAYEAAVSMLAEIKPELLVYDEYIGQARNVGREALKICKICIRMWRWNFLTEMSRPKMTLERDIEPSDIYCGAVLIQKELKKYGGRT